MKDNILEIINLRKVYHDKNSETIALDDINFSVKDKEYISIIGPSGCGKSTILGIIANIIDKSSGNIIFNKENIRIGYMLQTDCLFDWLSILDNCLLGLKIQNKLTEENIQKIKNMLTSYGLKDFINKYPNSLSGGMRQRVLRILYTHGMITYKWLITLINKGKEVYYVIR